MRLILIILLTSILLVNCKNEPSNQPSSVNFEFVELTDGVYSCIHKFGGKAICNVGIVDNGHETIIFDSFLSPDVAEELLKTLQGMSLSPVKYVVNSHFHNDHIRGNQVFSKEVNIISSTRTKELIAEEEPLQIAYEKENAPARLSYYDSLQRSFKGDRQSREYQQIQMWRPYYETLVNSHLTVKTRLPNMFVDSIKNFDGPDRKIQLLSKGQGHTESDLIMYLPDDGVLFTGDLIFNNCHPYVAHGDISKWKAWLEFMNSLEVSTVMPGHGQIGTDELINQMKDYLMDLESAAEDLVKDNLSLEEPENLSVPDKYKDWWFDRFYEYNLRFAYESLNTKKPK
ncbi:MAG: MBL fold metallo-hydrolase [Flavobacteriaceae bacterium]|nr:MBL fold metallo-hydrolase [Flavobacteriaceae bacterium]